MHEVQARSGCENGQEEPSPQFEQHQTTKQGVADAQSKGEQVSQKRCHVVLIG